MYMRMYMHMCMYRVHVYRTPHSRRDKQNSETELCPSTQGVELLLSCCTSVSDRGPETEETDRPGRSVGSRGGGRARLYIYIYICLSVCIYQLFTRFPRLGVDTGSLSRPRFAGRLPLGGGLSSGSCFLLNGDPCSLYVQGGRHVVQHVNGQRQSLRQMPPMSSWPQGYEGLSSRVSSSCHKGSEIVSE
jgi:hypothetical protein